MVGKNADANQINFFSADMQVSKETPPSFLIHAGDDASVPVENTLRYYEACIKNKVSVEMHLYQKGGHGFGLNNKTTDDSWMDRLKNWLGKL